MKFLCTLLIIGLLAFSGASAQDGLSLMKVETGARASGMAGAFVSITGDPLGPIYNPASSVGAEHFTATFGYNSYWENINMGHGYFISNLLNNMTLHGGIRYAGVNDLEGRDAPTIDPNDFTTFDANDISFKGGIAYAITPKIAAGISAGWYIEKISSYRGSAFNVDLGLIARPMPDLSLGAAVTSLGSDFTIEETGQLRSRDISLPTTYRVGGSYTWREYLGAADIVVVDDEAHLHLGAEGILHESFALRAGYMAGYDTKNITAGASFTRRNFTFDYAFVPYDNDLGTAHLFNLTIVL